jgi:hypothetical protein
MRTTWSSAIQTWCRQPWRVQSDPAQPRQCNAAPASFTTAPLGNDFGRRTTMKYPALPRRSVLLCRRGTFPVRCAAQNLLRSLKAVSVDLSDQLSASRRHALGHGVARPDEHDDLNVPVYHQSSPLMPRPSVAVFPVDAVGLAGSETPGGAYSDAADVDAMFSLGCLGPHHVAGVKAPDHLVAGVVPARESLRR